MEDPGFEPRPNHTAFLCWTCSLLVVFSVSYTVRWFGPGKQDLDPMCPHFSGNPEHWQAYGRWYTSWCVLPSLLFLPAAVCMWPHPTFATQPPWPHLLAHSPCLPLLGQFMERSTDLKSLSWEMQILSLYPRSDESEPLRKEPSNACVIESSRGFRCSLKFENTVL